MRPAIEGARSDETGPDPLLATLRSTFGFTAFRPYQQEIIEAIMAGRDVLALLPTGGGKSLCYQIPALLLDGLTVVVSPLIALMKDQVDHLQALGIPATYINSSLDWDEIRERQQAVARGEIKLLYVAPERLMTGGFIRRLRPLRVSLVAIDEAHCISAWGHDFRPEYRELSRIREVLPDVTMAAFTATATRRVQDDIVAQLGLRDLASFSASFNRPNLYYDVRPKQSAYLDLLAYLREKPRGSGIIYCSSRAGTEELAAKLAADGFAATAYHAGLESDERQRRQDAFLSDEVQIIVATIAFGMGIDKPDVRFVVHYDLPKNLESYYQESGRAGRDGLPSDCILYYSFGDVGRHEYFIRQMSSEQEREIAHIQLRQMADWAGNPECRRRALLAYFDEAYDSEVDHCCDVCERDDTTPVDYTIAAQQFMSCVARTRERFGMSHVIDVLRGSRSRRVLQFRHDQLSTHGIGRDRSAEEWRYLAQQLIRRGYVLQDAAAFNALKITERGRQVLFRGARVLLPPPVVKTATSAASARRGGGDYGQPGHPELFERLRALRRRLADEQQVPPFIIFSDVALIQIASELPLDEAAFRKVRGVGERKTAEYGRPFMAEVRRFVEETGARPVAAQFRPRPAAPPVTTGSTVHETLALFRQGYDIPAMMEARGLTRQTIEGHLASAIEAGEIESIDDLVAPARQRVIAAALAQCDETDPLRTVRDILGEEYGYGEIRFVKAAQARARRSPDRS